MGGGEVARYLGKYGSKGVSKAVIISGVPPFLLKTADNPEGVDGSVFSGIQKAVAADRATNGVPPETGTPKLLMQRAHIVLA